MRRFFRKTTLLVAIALMVALLAMPALAMDFGVRAILPENQRGGESGFFDLIVYPGQRQELLIEIANFSEDEIVVLVETITASTSRNGQINYTSRGILDETIKYSFEDLATLPESYYFIPAGSAIEVPIILTMPDGVFDGAILGSIRVLREATQDERDAAGAIVNQFAHVTAVRLVQSEDAEDMAADFALGDITMELINYRASFVANIRNTQPIIIKGATATARIYAKSGDQAATGQPMFEHAIESLEFAPNSVFPFSFVDMEGYGIDAGDYRAVIDIGHEGRNWSFEQDFNISEEAAAVVNDGAVNQHGQARPDHTGSAGNSGDVSGGGSGVPIRGVVFIAIGSAVLSAILVLLVTLTRKK